MRIGIIGGGDTLAALGIAYRELTVETPFGSPAAPLRIGTFRDHEIITLLRHGQGHAIPAHRVNYRANVWALYDCRVDLLIGISVCGSLAADVELGTLVMYDQILDFTRTRHGTFFDGPEVRHVEAAEPVCAASRRARFVSAVQSTGAPCRTSGTMVTIEGPRFSTLAESRMYRTLGGDFITMSAAPEAFLVRELGLCYMPISLVTDHDAANTDRVSITLIGETIERFHTRVSAAVAAVLDSVDGFASERCHHCRALPVSMPTNRLNLGPAARSSGN